MGRRRKVEEGERKSLMGLRISKGNMYPWVTHTHAHLGGECPHKCIYCYVNNPRFGRAKKYSGPLRLIETEFEVNYGSGKTIFIEHCNDLFAADVPQDFINRIVAHCLKWPTNMYVWQTKNPARYLSMDALFPSNSIFGTTIETNRSVSGISKAPPPIKRCEAIGHLTLRKFVSIEPIMDFDLDVLTEWILRINPLFVSIGADSKGHGLPEPTIGKVRRLIDNLRSHNIEVREKNNLDRLGR